jgi:hypothetical protein
MICPSRIRSCLTNLFVFQVMPKDWHTIKEEHIYKNYNILSKNIDNILTDHKFLYINLYNNKIYINFDEVLTTN